MNISIGIIKVNAISSIGSLNIGKTVLCKNTSNSNSYGSDGEQQTPDAEMPAPATTP